MTNAFTREAFILNLEALGEHQRKMAYNERFWNSRAKDTHDSLLYSLQ